MTGQSNRQNMAFGRPMVIIQNIYDAKCTKMFENGQKHA